MHSTDHSDSKDSYKVKKKKKNIFIIDNKQQIHHIRMISDSEGSFDTEYWSNDAGNSIIY